MKRSEHSAVHSKCPLWVKSRQVRRTSRCPLSAKSGLMEGSNHTVPAQPKPGGII
jgi:hypothetical protein